MGKPYSLAEEARTMLEGALITGQKLAIWLSSRSRWAFFWAVVSH